MDKRDNPFQQMVANAEMESPNFVSFPNMQALWDLDKQIARDFKEKRNQERVAEGDWKKRLHPRHNGSGALPLTL